MGMTAEANRNKEAIKKAEKKGSIITTFPTMTPTQEALYNQTLAKTSETMGTDTVTGAGEGTQASRILADTMTDIENYSRSPEEVSKWFDKYMSPGIISKTSAAYAGPGSENMASTMYAGAVSKSLSEAKAPYMYEEYKAGKEAPAWKLSALALAGDTEQKLLEIPGFSEAMEVLGISTFGTVVTPRTAQTSNVWGTVVSGLTNVAGAALKAV